jgi:hypothetical protein
MSVSDPRNIWHCQYLIHFHVGLSDIVMSISDPRNIWHCQYQIQGPYDISDIRFKDYLTLSISNKILEGHMTLSILKPRTTWHCWSVCQIQRPSDFAWKLFHIVNVTKSIYNFIQNNINMYWRIMQLGFVELMQVTDCKYFILLPR